MTAAPEPGDPWADPDYHPQLAPPMSDSFYRAIGDYCRAENAKAEPSFIGGLPEDGITVNAEHEIVAAGPEEPELEGYDPGPEVDDEGGMSEYRRFAEWAEIDRAEYEREAGL